MLWAWAAAGLVNMGRQEVDVASRRWVALTACELAVHLTFGWELWRLLAVGWIRRG